MMACIWASVRRTCSHQTGACHLDRLHVAGRLEDDYGGIVQGRSGGEIRYVSH